LKDTWVLIGRIALVALGVVLLVPQALQKVLLSQHAVLGLALLVLLLVEGLLAVVGKRTGRSYRGILITGFVMGLIAGGIVDYLVPPPEKGDLRGLRSVRIIIFAGFIAAAIYLLLQVILSHRTKMTGTPFQRAISMFVSFSAVFIGGTWLSMEMEHVGWLLSKLTNGAIDWVGTGACKSHDAMDIACRLPPRMDTPEIAAAMLGIFFVLAGLWDFRRWKISAVHGSVAIGIIAVWGLLLYFGMRLFSNNVLPVPIDGNEPALTRLVRLVPFLVGMSIYAVVFSYVISWSRNRGLADALMDAFKTSENFRAMMDARLGRETAPGVRFASFKDEVKSVVKQAATEGWLDQLVMSARFSRPQHPGLAMHARRMRLDVVLPDASVTAARVNDPSITANQSSESQLETIVRKDSKFKDPTVWMGLMTQAISRVCRIETRVSPLGTGWLVGPDLVLTNHHVVRDMFGPHPTLTAKDVFCRFDYRVGADGRQLNEGTIVKLDLQKPILDSSPHSPLDTQDTTETPQPDQLDFALIRLAEKVGELPIGGKAEPGAALRGWISLKTAKTKPAPTNEIVGERVLVLQHPAGMPIKLEIGAVTQLNGNGTRIRHTANTEGGSSGSPCFNADLEPIALHHAGGHSKTIRLPYNQAVPIGCIIKLLEQRNPAERFWDTEPAPPPAPTG
jgi:hypothetical protein